MSKTLRQFQCRDDLWARVDALAKRRGISADDVVQAALLQLFKSKPKKEGESSVVTPAPAQAPATTPARPGAPAAQPAPVTPAAPSPVGAGMPKPAPTLPRPQAPTAAPTRLPPPAAKPAVQQVRPLYIMFENEWFEVDKEEFVIGRGQKFSDLPIKDANISRRHCSIVRRGGDYFIKDLGSTNGIEFEGTRVDNHKIVEGSVYFLCDHELRFSFTPPSSAS